MNSAIQPQVDSVDQTSSFSAKLRLSASAPAAHRTLSTPASARYAPTNVTHPLRAARLPGVLFMASLVSADVLADAVFAGASPSPGLPRARDSDAPAADARQVGSRPCSHHAGSLTGPSAASPPLTRPTPGATPAARPMRRKRRALLRSEQLGPRAHPVRGRARRDRGRAARGPPAAPPLRQPQGAVRRPAGRAARSRRAAARVRPRSRRRSHETRRAAVVDEANAIGTTYLRAQTLREPDAPTRSGC